MRRRMPQCGQHTCIRPSTLAIRRYFWCMLTIPAWNAHSTQTLYWSMMNPRKRWNHFPNKNIIKPMFDLDYVYTYIRLNLLFSLVVSVLYIVDSHRLQCCVLMSVCERDAHTWSFNEFYRAIFNCKSDWDQFMEYGTRATKSDSESHTNNSAHKSYNL